MTTLDAVLSDVLGDLSTLKSAINHIPEGNDYEYASVFESFAEPVDAFSSRIAQLLQSACPASAARIDTDHRTGDRFGLTNAVIHEIDKCLKLTDSCVEAMRESVPPPDTPESTTFESQFAENSTVARPVLDPAPDNAMRVFRPFHRDLNDRHVVGPAGVHPYCAYIQSWAIPPDHLAGCEEPPYEADVGKTPLVFVATVAELTRMIDDLERTDVIAVDLEHHQFHSYLGLTCLMQISTATADYLVDTIALRGDVHRLKGVFLSAAIVKVFHGAAEDVKWLQRDFGLYVCNMFDTGIALQQLRQPRGLAHLLRSLCGIAVDKSYQLADWRKRPLSQGMVEYARGDTHYLIYCYAKLRNMLKTSDEEVGNGGLLRKVWEESRQLCLTLYELAEVTEERCDEAFARQYSDLDAQQIALVRALFLWRDEKCREMDESYHAVMSNSTLTRIARQRPVSAEDFALYVGKRTTTLTPFIGEILEVVRNITETVSKEAIVSTFRPAGAAYSKAQAFVQGHVEFTGTLPSLDGAGLEADGQCDFKAAVSMPAKTFFPGASLYDVCDSRLTA